MASQTPVEDAIREKVKLNSIFRHGRRTGSERAVAEEGGCARLL